MRRRSVKLFMERNGWTGWIQPLFVFPGRAHRMTCCDCGLVHDVQMHVEPDGTVLYRVRRSERSTAATRRGNETRVGIKKLAALLSR